MKIVWALLGWMPIEWVLKLHYAIRSQLHSKIYRARPHIKLLKGTPFSFSEFVVKHTDNANALSVLDVGAHDCFLANELSKRLHPASRFVCFDVVRQPQMYLNDQIEFTQADFIEMLRNGYSRKFDVIILSGMIPLFSDVERKVLFQYMRNCGSLFIREGARFPDIIDIYCEANLKSYTGYENLCESDLTALVQGEGFDVVMVEHEFDVYLKAQPASKDVGTPSDSRPLLRSSSRIPSQRQG